MAKTAPTYDLMLLLNPAAAEEQREKILNDTEATITRLGEVIGKHQWGQRATAYEIRHKGEAEYHLIQFHATRELLESLDRTLRITDGVVRYRIIKLAPGTPAPPDPKTTLPPVAAPAGEEPAPTPA